MVDSQHKTHLFIEGAHRTEEVNQVNHDTVKILPFFLTAKFPSYFGCCFKTPVNILDCVSQVTFCSLLNRIILISAEELK